MAEDEDPPVPLFYRLFGYWIRRDACRLASQTLRSGETEDGYAPRVWSLTVFFENYLMSGAAGTREEFGPVEPAELHEIISGDR